MGDSKKTPADIDAYIGTFPPNVQERLETIRQIIKEVVPEAKESIKYGLPAFTYHGNLVYFAAWKKHIGVYPITAEMEANIEELAAYNTSGKGTIQFPMNQPLPIPLIRTIVEFRVAEHLASAAKKQ